MDVNFDITTRQKSVFGCLQTTHAQDFLLAIPIDGLEKDMSPVEYHVILKYLLMIHLFPIDEVFPVCCNTCLDTFGEHTIYCKELPGFKYRHDFIMDILFDIFKSERVYMKKERSMNFLTDPHEGRLTLRPIILVSSCQGYGHKEDVSTNFSLTISLLIPQEEHDCLDLLLDCEEEFDVSYFSGDLKISKLYLVVTQLARE
ncbi:unnamed protein product [Lathyrus sativus]|nr:unnamed protein product [Lathyrus sativus]